MTTKFITVAEAAAHFRIPKTKVYELVRSKEFPALKFGKSWRIDCVALEDWIKNQIANKQASC